jgi:hypothetical protein
MLMRRRVHIPGLVVTVVVSWAPAAQAAECGTTDTQTKKIARATLTLDPDSVTTIAYQRATDPETLLLRFKATGCDLPNEAPRPNIDVLPKQGTKNIPDNVVKLIRAVPDGSEYSLRLTAGPESFDPGSYGGFFELRAPFLVTTRTPIALSRSESNNIGPIALGMIGGLAGLAWFLLLSNAKGAKATIGLRQYIIVFIAAAIAGIIAVESAYRAQEVWTFGENWLSAIIAAFTGATTGSMATAIGVLFPEPGK